MVNKQSQKKEMKNPMKTILDLVTIIRHETVECACQSFCTFW